MESLEVSAKTVEEAVEQALQQLRASRSQVEIEVLSEGRTGILGFGAEDARVKVTLLQPIPEVARIAREVLENILDSLGLDVTVNESSSPLQETPPGSEMVAFDIQGQDLGILIGRRGQTLSALQYLVNVMVSRRLKTRTAIILDIEGYRQRRYEALKGMALHMAERVKATGQSITLEPMSPAERRIIHIALQNHPDIVTQSIGEGDTRKVSIFLRRRP